MKNACFCITIHPVTHISSPSQAAAHSQQHFYHSPTNPEQLHGRSPPLPIITNCRTHHPHTPAASSRAAIQLGFAPQPKACRRPALLLYPPLNPSEHTGSSAGGRQTELGPQEQSEQLCACMALMGNQPGLHTQLCSRTGSKTSCSVSKGSSFVAAVEPAGLLAAPPLWDQGIISAIDRLPSEAPKQKSVSKTKV